MLKRTLIVLLCTLIFLNLTNDSLACTSFAQYSDKALFGMNFDYPDTPIKLNFTEEGGAKIFYTQFKEGENFYLFCAMSSKGLFIPTQIQYPSLPGKKELRPDELSIGELPNRVLLFEHVSEVRDLLKSYRLVPTFFPIHTMVADKHGDAVICEINKDGNALVDVKDSFLVMTNFKHSDFMDKPYTEVFGGGSDRYKTACETIEKNLDGFDQEDGWEVLKKTVETNPSSQTLMSSIFDPVENVIYFALMRDFNRVWKISLEKGTLETYQGFDTPYKITIPPEGILSTDLVGNKIALEAQKEVDATSKPYLNEFILIAAVTLVLTLPSLLLFRKKRIVIKK